MFQRQIDSEWHHFQWGWPVVQQGFEFGSVCAAGVVRKNGSIETAYVCHVVRQLGRPVEQLPKIWCAGWLEPVSDAGVSGSKTSSHVASNERCYGDGKALE